MDVALCSSTRPAIGVVGTGVIGGMLAATFIAVLFIPLFFVWTSRVGDAVRRRFAGGDARPQA